MGEGLRLYDVRIRRAVTRSGGTPWVIAARESLGGAADGAQAVPSGLGVVLSQETGGTPLPLGDLVAVGSFSGGVTS